MIALKFVLPEWLDVLLQYRWQKSLVSFFAPCGSLVHADLRVTNAEGEDWVVQIKTRDIWIHGVLSTKNRLVLVRQSDFHFN